MKSRRSARIKTVMFGAGTSIGGFNRLNPHTGVFDNYTHNTDEINSLSSNRVICLYVDSRSDLWIGVFGGGLNKWLSDRNSFSHYTTEHGLRSNVVNSIVEDSTGILWISTDHGISVLKYCHKRVRNYDANDGLSSNNFLQGAGYGKQRVCLFRQQQGTEFLDNLRTGNENGFRHRIYRF